MLYVVRPIIDPQRLEPNGLNLELGLRETSYVF